MKLSKIYRLNKRAITTYDIQTYNSEVSTQSGHNEFLRICSQKSPLQPAGSKYTIKTHSCTKYIGR